jgi:hypothetical protein
MSKLSEARKVRSIVIAIIGISLMLIGLTIIRESVLFIIGFALIYVGLFVGALERITGQSK